MYPVLPFTAFSAAVTQVQGSSLMYGLSDSANVSSATLVDPLPGSSSLYGLPDSASASSATLVDPVNHWTTHRYNDPSTVMGQIGPPSQRATQLGTAGQGVSLSKIQQQFYGKASPTHGNNSGLRKEEYQGALDKDLPPLPIEATVMTSNDDPNAILSHLYSEYNSNASISPSWVTPLEGFAAQLIAAKEADSDSTMGVMSLGESSGELAQWQQQTYLGGEQKDGQQLQYLIKPACPVRYMSFADVGHESMSMMDVFSWPSDSSSSSNSSNSSNSSGS
ncbi:hypothetical protein BC939DRAFT_456368 [Gamsiella multidivaricata]|uniref:uncharacterized protein n=1 Tax=Gamsiella multidivaricata TaxID=101098 RepID=UPI00222083BD|nr:uncharacterized protein BC939DRAFT_456368 [Gamsiella multidivaricata]KAI7821048.1 hypothetical protein BC939DRAFT_456368 [Gamsiella multidivaricata]